MTGGLMCDSVRKRSTLFGVILILVSLLPLTIYTETVEASVSGEMGISSSTPADDSIIASFESIRFGATVHNFATQISPQRNIDWNVCLGDRVANSCIANSIATGQISVPPVPAGQQSYVESNVYFNPNGLNETITVVYQFNQLDTNPSNDLLVVNMHPSSEFTDLRVDDTQELSLIHI